MTPLYNIAADFRSVLKAIEENDGLLTPELESALAISQQELEAKGINYGLAIKEFDGNVDLIDAEIERLNKIKAKNKNLAEKLRGKISAAMIEFNVERIETATMTLSFRKSEETVISNESEVGEQFKITKPVTTIDKAAIKKAIKEGEVVAGAYILEKKNLQIK